jgi:hypothetical protein
MSAAQNGIERRTRGRRTLAAGVVALVSMSAIGALGTVGTSTAMGQSDGPILPVTTPSIPVTPPTPPVPVPVPPVTPPVSTSAAPFGTSAVVLVGGFNSSSPFSTPACATADRGPTWGEPSGPAAAISAAGYPVFTAPIANSGTPVAASCLGGQSTPDIPSNGSTVIDSNGALAGNQAALVAFLQFLSASYGITSVQLVGHSDGGLWSRAAISQLRSTGSPITVTNLTTVGTPHIGSFGADIAEDLNADGGSCSDLNSPVEEAVCDLVFSSIGAIVDDLGPDVIEELSSTWLSQWNPTTTIGCPVTTLDGDYVGWSLGLGYYTPNDGIVGQASALNQATLIPSLTPAPFTSVAPPSPQPQSFDVVHSQSLSFLSPNNELNTASVAAAIAASVQAPPSSVCVAASSSRQVAGAGASARGSVDAGGADAAAAAAVPASSASAADDADGASSAGGADAAPAVATSAVARPSTRAVTVTLPMRRRHAVRNGTLSRPHSGDAILLLKGASVRCGSQELPAAPLLGSQAVRIVVPRCARPVTVRGRALHLVRASSAVRLTRDGAALRWSITGSGLRKVHAQVRVDGRWRAVHGTRVAVPAAAHEPALRVVGRDRAGHTVRAFTRIAV